MAKAKASTSNRKPTTVANIARSRGGQARIRRELANQRRAMGAAGAQRAMQNWGLRASNTPKAAGKRTASRAGDGTGKSGKRNG